MESHQVIGFLITLLHTDVVRHTAGTEVTDDGLDFYIQSKLKDL